MLSPPVVAAIIISDHTGINCLKYGCERLKNGKQSNAAIEQFTTGFRYGSAAHEPISFRKQAAEAVARAEAVGLWPPSANNAQAVVMSVVSGTPYYCADRSF
jgi:hypothetical protein